jgi:hypothetical protein
MMNDPTSVKVQIRTFSFIITHATYHRIHFRPPTYHNVFYLPSPHHHPFLSIFNLTLQNRTHTTDTTFQQRNTHSAMSSDQVPIFWRWVLFKEWLRCMKIRARNYHAGPKKTDPQSGLYYDYRTTKLRPTQNAESAHPGVQYYA